MAVLVPAQLRRTFDDWCRYEGLGVPSTTAQAAFSLGASAAPDRRPGLSGRKTLC